MSGQVSDSVIIPHRTRSRRLSWQDAELIAKDIAKARLTESEACEIHGIRPSCWFQWKSRNKNSARFEQIVARVRAVTIKARIEQIENSASGIGLKHPDWRAADRLLSIADPNRYGREAGSDHVQNTTVNITLFTEALKRVYGDAKPAIVVSDQPKAIDAPQPVVGQIDVVSTSDKPQ